MGSRDKGGREAKKPKKVVKETRSLVTSEPVSMSVEVVPRKRKSRDDDE